MYRYSKDTSTSSEDDTSTAEAAPTTADMCRSKVRNGEKVLRCTGCGYESDRRANVTRHYLRIHGELKKRRKCSCGEVFHTKWEFYKHCDEQHPTMRQSSYTTTHVYKLKQSTQTKRKLKSVRRSRRVESRKLRVEKGLAMRSSARLRSRGMDISNSSTSVNSKSDKEVSSPTSQEFFSASSTTAEVTPMFIAEASSDVSNRVTPMFIDETCSDVSNREIPMFIDETCSDVSNKVTPIFISETCSDVSNRVSSMNCPVSFSTSCSSVSDLNHLPIKKRHRKILGDITNNNVDVQRNYPFIDSNNNNQVPMRQLYLSNIDQHQRAYIDHIDFDELDAILQLWDMKRIANHVSV